jgi:glycosyltransferase 2 family protein
MVSLYTDSPDLPTPRRSRRRLLVSIGLRVLVGIVLIVVVQHQLDDFDRDEFLPHFTRTTVAWLVGAFLLTIAAMVLAAVRWQRVLRALGSDESLGRLYSHYMAGQFLSNFVPSSVGGDVLRVSRLGRDIADHPVAFTSVIFERLSGWLVLPIITYVGFAVNPGLTHLGAATRTPLIVATLTLLALITIIGVVGSNWIGESVDGRSGVLRFANAVHLGIDRMREHRHQAGEVLVAAFAYQLTVLAAAYCAAEAMEIDPIGPTALMAFLPAVLIVQVLPLLPGGFGIREGAMVLFLSEIAVPSERAFSFGLLLGLLVLSASLIGLPALLLGGRPRKGSPVPAPRPTTPAPSSAGTVERSTALENR